MKQRNPQSIVNQSATLSRLYAKAHFQTQVLKRLHRHLPYPKTAIQSCYLDNTRFVIYCSSAAWANKLKFRTQEMLETLKNNDPELLPQGLESIKVQFHPKHSA